MITKKVKIKDIGNIITGKTPPTKSKEYYGNDFVFIKPTYIDVNSRYFENIVEKVSIEAFEKYESSFVPPNSICVVTIGSIGEKICLTKELCLTNQAINTIIPYQNKYDNMFVYYLLKYNLYKVKAMNNGTSSGRENVSKSAFENIEVEVTDFETQKRIGKVLAAYDDLIENNLKRIELLEETAESIYKEWFINFRFPGCEKCEFIDEVPRGWEKAHLSEIVSTQYGFTESALDEDTGVKYLRGTDINKTSYVNWSTVPWCKINDSDKYKYQLRKYDIVVIRMANPGKVGIVEKDIEAVFASYLIRLSITTEKIKPYYLFYFINSDYYQQFISQASTGATRKSANAKLITDVDIIIPKKEIIEQFEVKIANLRKLLNNLLEQNDKLKEARDILIPKLIMGEIEV